MTETTDTLVIGAGQAGLSVSFYLKQLGVEHIVLEKSEIGASWRRYWDSFTLVTPNSMSNLPDFPSAGEPGIFLERDAVIRYLEDFAASFSPPLYTGVTVHSVEAHSSGQGFQVQTSKGSFHCRSVVVATGTFQQPRLPSYATELPARVVQLHSSESRNPYELPEGAVLVVGSGQSGAQIAEELHRAGRKVYLSVSRAGRAPRRYRGRDIMDWFRLFGLFERTVSQLESPAERFDAHPHISGREGGRTINLRRLGREGVTLLGKVHAVEGGYILLSPGLEQNLRAADTFAEQLCGMIDKRIEEAGLDAPKPAAAEICDDNWEPLEHLSELSVTRAGIRALVWATGYRFDFTWIKVPVFDAFGYPIQQRGVTAYPNLYFVGLHWLHKLKSGLLYGVAEDAAYVAQQVAMGSATL